MLNFPLCRLAQLISIFISVWLTAAGIIYLVSTFNNFLANKFNFWTFFNFSSKTAVTLHISQMESNWRTGTVSTSSWSPCQLLVRPNVTFSLLLISKLFIKGYGDMSCQTVLGKIAIVLFILVGLVTVLIVFVFHQNKMFPRQCLRQAFRKSLN